MLRSFRITRSSKSVIALALIVVVMGAVIATGAGVLARGTSSSYTPQTRSYTITAVPVLVHEMQGTLDYLQKDFAPGGVLDGKEVYGFMPSTLTVYQGDTVNLTLVNPADDPHTLTISEFGVNAQMPGTSSTTTSFVASKAGIYTYVCEEAEHFPYMYGQLVVLPDPASAQ
ncbi:MAG TPA: cupredoxin domain-containing protein [Nitrolancea sp.]